MELEPPEEEEEAIDAGDELPDELTLDELEPADPSSRRDSSPPDRPRQSRRPSLPRSRRNRSRRSSRLSPSERELRLVSCAQAACFVRPGPSRTRRPQTATQAITIQRMRGSIVVLTLMPASSRVAGVEPQASPQCDRNQVARTSVHLPNGPKSVPRNPHALRASYERIL